MQKKIVLALLMIALVVGGAFAQLNLSAGVGGLFDLSFRNGLKTIDLPGDKEMYVGSSNQSIGGHIFFDVTYAELDVNFTFGSISSVFVDTDGNKEVNGPKGDDKRISAMQLGFSLLGKYPIYLGNVTVFPLLGVDYNIVLSTKVDKKALPNPGYSNQFGLLAGIGGDFNLTKSLFVRAEGLFHLRLASKNAKDAKDLAVKGGAKEEQLKTTLGMGPQIRLALGYRF